MGLGTRERLGDLLVAQGVLTVEALDRALAAQAESREPLGTILVREAAVAESAVLEAVAEQVGVAVVDPIDIDIDGAAAALINERAARRLRALPVGWDGGNLFVAMADPRDVFALDDLRAMTGFKITPALAAWDRLVQAIEAVWGAEQHLSASLVSPAPVRDRGRVAEVSSTSSTTSAAAPSPPTSALAAPAAGAPDDRVILFVDRLLSRAVRDRASDIHFDPTTDGSKVRFRIDGVLHEVMTIPSATSPTVVGRLKIMGGLDIAERRLPQDGRVTMAVSGRTVDLRMVTLPTADGEAVVLRILDRDTGILSVGDLGFSASALAVYEAAYRKPWGAILVTGPTGSGKSTTLYATLAEVNDPKLNIVTVEDPIEYRIQGIKQMQVHRRAGLTFAGALRSVLRADPDIVMVGEIRDQETARMATEAALTGHLVLSTLHTGDAAQTPLRLTEMGVEPYLVTSAISCVLAQRLVRRLCDQCKQLMGADETRESLNRYADVIGTEFFRPVGCRVCNMTGYRGRFALHEVMPMTDEICRLVVGGSSSAAIKALAVEQGMVTLFDDGVEKCAQGLTSPDELWRVVE